MGSVGERIRARRQALGLTQDELARRAGISKSFLSDVENGKRSVSADNLLDLGQVLGRSLDYLMTGESTGVPGAGPVEERAAAKEVRIPTSLSAFASQVGLSHRETLALLGMQQQILANRKKQDRDEDFDWATFYERVKDFL